MTKEYDRSKDKMIKIKNISKKIKGTEVIKNVSCELEPGHVYGIYGRNGSGKTMLMRCMLGLISIDSGEVEIEGKKIGKEIDQPQSVGAIIENVNFFTYATGLENLKMLAAINKKISEKKIRETLERVGLDPDDKRLVSKYSLGMKQRLAIAQAIMEEPDLLVLDEPTNALDEEGIDRFRKIIQEEAKRKATIIIASHNKEDITLLSDVKMRMEAGRLIEVEVNDRKECIC